MWHEGQITEVACGALKLWDPPDWPLAGAWPGEAGNHYPKVWGLTILRCPKTLFWSSLWIDVIEASVHIILTCISESKTRREAVVWVRAPEEHVRLWEAARAWRRDRPDHSSARVGAHCEAWMWLHLPPLGCSPSLEAVIATCTLQRFLPLSSLYTQHGTLTYNPEIKTCMRSQLSQLGAPNLFLKTFK